jgi:flagellar biosynthesis/type III secretory pathway protein FliH
LIDEREKEVVNIMMELFDDDYIMDAFLKSERNEAKNEGIQEGMQKGMIETCKEFGLSFLDTVKKIADKFGLTEEGSRAEVEKYWYSA